MNLIPIAPGESLLQAFFDGSESYPDNQKYACFDRYRVTVGDGCRADVKQSWCDVQILIYEALADRPAVTLERDCDLDVSEFDLFRICANWSNSQVRITLKTELGQEVAIEKSEITGRELAGSFRGKHLLGIRLEVFITNEAQPANLALRWFSLADSHYPEGKKIRFSSDWEGCFADTYETGPEIGIWFGKDQLPAIREKVKTPPFDRMYDNLRREAQSYLSLEPESMIEEYLINENPFFTRDGHKFRGLVEYLPVLSFVGMVENDPQMIRLAGRVLLSIAVTPRWCESFMGDCPGVTWHHRSFLEGLAVKRCALALDWIGSCLTWHGKNLVYDAIVQKGLPRVEADMFCVEYVRKTNQGVVFNNERICAYIALAKRYPRYAKMLAIAEADFFEMVDTCIEPDGGYLEGPSYWNYAMDNIVESAHMLARYHGKPLAEFAPERMKKSGQYGLSMLTSRPDGLRWFLINDSYGYGQYGSAICDFYYRMTQDPTWGALLQEQLQKGGGLETLLMVERCPEASGEPKLPEGMLCLKESGEVALHRQVGETEILWHFSAGQPYFSHFHEDKGQLVLNVNRQELLCDRGNASSISKKPISHNLLVPERDGLPYSQPADAAGGKVLLAEDVDGRFRYEAELTDAWEEGLFEKITRQVCSDHPLEAVVTDRAVCLREQPVSVRFHSVYPIEAQEGRFCVRGETATLWITPVNYTPERFVIREDGKSVNGELVWQLILHLPVAREYAISTKLEIKI